MILQFSAASRSSRSDARLFDFHLRILEVRNGIENSITLHVKGGKFQEETMTIKSRDNKKSDGRELEVEKTDKHSVQNV